MESMNLIYYLTLIKKSNMPLVTFQKLNEACKPLTFAGSTQLLTQQSMQTIGGVDSDVKEEALWNVVTRGT